MHGTSDTVLEVLGVTLQMATVTQNAVSRLRERFGPPVLATPEQTSRALTLWKVVWAVLAVWTTGLILYVLERPETLAFRLVSGVVIWTIALAVMETNRRGHTALGSWCLVIGLVGLTTNRAWYSGGLHSPLLPLYVIFVVMGALLLERRGSTIVTAVCVVCAGFLCLAEVMGVLPDAKFNWPPLSLFLFVTFSMALALLLGNMISSTLRENLKRADSELAQRRHAQFRLELALEAGKISVWEQDPITLRICGDARLFELFGLAQPEDARMSYETWAARVHAEDLPEVTNKLRSLAAGQPTTRTAFRIVLPDGRERYVEGAAALMPREGTGPPRIVGVLEDISEQMASARDRERLLRELQERAKELTCLYRLSKSIQARDTVNELLRDAVELIPQGWLYPEITCSRVRFEGQEFVTNSFKETPWRQACDIVIRGESRGSVEVYLLEERPAADEGPFLKEERHLIEGIAHNLGVAIQRRMAAESLVNSERRYRELVDGARDVIFALTPEGIITSLNPAFEQITGMPAADWIGKQFTDLVHADDVERVRVEFKSSLAGQPVQGPPVRLRAANGDYRFGEVNIAPRIENGRVTSVFGIGRDVSDRVSLENQLRQAQKMEAVGRLAGGVAHDFNNMLGVIIGYGQLLQIKVPHNSEMGDQLNEVVLAAQRAAGLTRQLLAFSRKQVLQPAVLNLNTTVVDLEKLLQRLIGEHIQLNTRLDPELGQTRMDPSQLEQVIVNLAVNARDAMANGGHLTIETHNVVLGKEYTGKHGVTLQGPHILLAVSDTGCGMSAATRERIFEPFFTTKEEGKGTGLGLATVYGIVNQSGGFIWVYSELGQGTTFKIYLPRVDAPVEKLVVAASSESPGGTETILLVEDERSLRRLAQIFLQEAGYTVMNAGNMEEALGHAAAHAGAIHILVTDVVMPGGSGSTLASRLQDGHPEAKTLFVSGYTDDAIVHHGVLNAGNAFLEKPYSRDGLLRKVREVLDAPKHPA